MQSFTFSHKAIVNLTNCSVKFKVGEEEVGILLFHKGSIEIAPTIT